MNIEIEAPYSHVAAQSSVRLSVILPTFKERGNVEVLVARLDRALAGIAWEAIFVDDDSPDGTAEAAKALAQKDPRVRCLKRIGRRGLAGACIEGILSSSAPYVAVMDADLQHDETILPKMLARLERDEADLVVGSRYVDGGSASSFDQKRGFISRFATHLTKSILGTPVSDPMSGFFAMRRDRFDEVAGNLTPVGFKILLDIVTAAGHLRVAEEAYTFGTRQEGESKFNVQVGLEFLGLLLAKASGGTLEPRFIFFALVGTSGLIVHLIALKLALGSHLSFTRGQAIATFIAMSTNFLFNNNFTYRDRRLRGVSAVAGYSLFCIIGGIGAFATVGFATWLYSSEPVWWVAGAAGGIMSVFWNYSMSSLFVWRTR
ncbi:MAG TPA: glycosyltransferase family 2 protein [Rhizomicrobium sp.]|nr:glycosyltransferase family 2 protein [Rhizomicrobium sp.]